MDDGGGVARVTTGPMSVGHKEIFMVISYHEERVLGAPEAKITSLFSQKVTYRLKKPPFPVRDLMHANAGSAALDLAIDKHRTLSSKSQCYKITTGVCALRERRPGLGEGWIDFPRSHCAPRNYR